MAKGGGCRDERCGSSASEVGTDDGTAKKKKKKKFFFFFFFFKSSVKPLLHRLKRFVAYQKQTQAEDGIQNQE